jgi:hypothetical protein
MTLPLHPHPELVARLDVRCTCGRSELIARTWRGRTIWTAGHADDCAFGQHVERERTEGSSPSPVGEFSSGWSPTEHPATSPVASLVREADFR